MEFLQASLTTSRNPSMRIFYIDPDTYELLDFDNYYLDLDVVSGMGALFNSSNTLLFSLFSYI